MKKGIFNKEYYYKNTKSIKNINYFFAFQRQYKSFNVIF